MIVLGTSRRRPGRLVVWGAALLLLSALLAVTAATTERSEAADCTPVELSDFGTTPMTIPDPPQGQYVCFLVTSDEAGPYAFTSGYGSASVYTLDGRQLLDQFFGYLQAVQVYELEAGTTYEVRAYGRSFAAYDVLAGGGCPALTDLTWDTPEDLTDLRGYVVPCRTIPAPQGSVLRLDGAVDSERGVVDGDGDLVCGGITSARGKQCALDMGPGPYRMLVAARGATNADVSVVDTASEGGCERIAAVPWSRTVPSYERDGSRWHCFAFAPDATGGHLMRSVADRDWARFELWQVAAGEVERNTTDDTAYPAVFQDFEGGGDYRVVLSGSPPSGDPTYRFGIFDLRRDLDCRDGVDTGWGARAEGGLVTHGAFDCYSFAAQAPEDFRLQADAAAGDAWAFVTNGLGDLLCSTRGPRRSWSDRIGVCGIEGPGPYRVIVGQNMDRDRSTLLQPYEVYLTQADSGGCPRVELGAWDEPLPVVADGVGKPYHCYALTTGTHSYHQLSTWRAANAGERTFELWHAAADPQGEPHIDLPDGPRRLELAPNAEYRLVATPTAGSATGTGEYRAGLFDVGGSAGCPRADDLGWTAPQVTGTVTKGELDCLEIPGQRGDIRLLDHFGTRIYSADGFQCARVCELVGTGPWRAVTSAGLTPNGDGYDYAYWVNDVADQSDCADATAADRPESPPLSAVLAPGERRCFVVDVTAPGIFTWQTSTPAEVPGLDPPLIVSPEGDVCELNEAQDLCGLALGRQAMVLGNSQGPTQTTDVLVRDLAAYPDGCAQLTSTTLEGELRGRYDEECFTFSVPAGSRFSVEVGDPTGRAMPVAQLLERRGVACGNTVSPTVWQCVAPGGSVTLSIVNLADTNGRYRVRIAPDRAGYVLLPKVTGKPRVGRVLRLKGGIASPSGSTRKVEWLRGKKKVGSGGAYRVRRADRGHRIKARITLTAPGYAAGVYVVRGPRIKGR